MISRGLTTQQQSSFFITPASLIANIFSLVKNIIQSSLIVYYTRSLKDCLFLLSSNLATPCPNSNIDQDMPRQKVSSIL